MKRLLLLSLLMACGSDITAPPAEVVGTYSVTSFSTTELPVATLTASGTLVLNADGTFTLATHSLAAWDAVKSGHYSVRGSVVTLSPPKLSGEVRYGGIRFVAPSCTSPQSGLCYPTVIFTKQ